MITDAKSMYNRAMDVRMGDIYKKIKETADEGKFYCYINTKELNIDNKKIIRKLNDGGFTCTEDNSGIDINWDINENEDNVSVDTSTKDNIDHNYISYSGY